MKTKNLDKEIELPPEVEVSIEGSDVKFKGQNGELIRTLPSPRIAIKLEDKKLVVFGNRLAKREKTLINTFTALLKTAIRSVQENHVYTLKICSGHFPMNVSVNGDLFVVKNLFGEKIPRKIKIKEGAEVKIEGEIVTVTAQDKSLAGQVAADIEQLTRRPGFDHRIFQDGIYITSKDGKEIQ